MKKSIVIIIAIVFISTIATATDIKQARQNLGYELNQTVNVLKKYFSTIKNQLEDDTSSMAEINTQVETLANSSKDFENNYTVLPQGKSSIEICKDNEELRWKNSQWICERPNYLSDCIEAPGETKISKKTGSYICKQNGYISLKNLGYGICNENTGERKTQLSCLFNNLKTNKSYQISEKNCNTSGITIYTQACGSNGNNSSCKCPSGSIYKYINGKPQCAYEINYVEDTSKTLYTSHSGYMNINNGTCKDRGSTVHQGEGCFNVPYPKNSIIDYIKTGFWASNMTKVTVSTLGTSKTWKVNSGNSDIVHIELKPNKETFNNPYEQLCATLNFQRITRVLSTVYVKWRTPKVSMHWVDSKGNTITTTNNYQCIEGAATKDISNSKIYSSCWKKHILVNIPTCQ